MSKLRERTRDLSRRRPAAFGFAAMRESAQAAASRQLLVVAEVSDVAATQRAVTAGADAVIYDGPLDHLTEVVSAAGRAVVGVRDDAATKEVAAAVIAAGADFLVCSDEHADAAALVEPRLGYILLAPTATTPGLSPDESGTAALRLLRPLDLDGILLPGLPEHMTVREQLRARRLGELARKPLFVRAPSAVTADTLELWRDAGVVAAVTGSDGVAGLVAAADAVPAPRQRADEHREANVPAPRSSSFDEDDDDEEP